MAVKSVPFKIDFSPALSGRPPLPAKFQGAAPSKPLTVSAADLDARVDELTGARVRLGVPLGISAAGNRLSVLIDPTVRCSGTDLLQVLPKLPELEAHAQVPSPVLGRVVGKLHGLSTLYSAIDIHTRRLGASQVVCGAVLRKLRVDIIDAARYMLGVPTLKTDLRQRLQLALGPIELEETKQQEAAQRRRSQTKTAIAKTQAELDRLAAENLLHQVIGDVRAGKPVVAEEVVEAARIQDEQRNERAAAVAATLAANREAKKKAERRTGGR